MSNGILFERDRCVAEAWKNLVFSSPSTAPLILPLCFQKEIFCLIAACNRFEIVSLSFSSRRERGASSSLRSRARIASLQFAPVGRWA